MKILMVSMSSIHFFRWTEQLKDAGHEVFWFDIVDGGEIVKRINWVHQIVGWKLRWNLPGRIFIKSKFPRLYKWLQKINERNTAKEFEKVLKKVQPDVVHSFALYVACTPIVEVMKKYVHIKWLYSSWGSDLYYFQNESSYLVDIKNVLPRVDYLFTDCKRDYCLAVKYGFKGEFLGVFPGGGGFDLEMMNQYVVPLVLRNTILIKGYQGRSGRAIQVLKAIELLKAELKKYNIIVFGADEEVIDYCKLSKLTKWDNFSIIGKVNHLEVIILMGKSLIYIGNSNSDGIPNTLLEAICMGAFPIQSNPGNVTEEVVEGAVNGFLINDCENVKEIKGLIEILTSNAKLIENAFEINQNEIKYTLDKEWIKERVLKKYSLIKHKN